jgi:hypothetical protein
VAIWRRSADKNIKSFLKTDLAAWLANPVPAYQSRRTLRSNSWVRADDRLFCACAICSIPRISIGFASGAS